MTWITENWPMVLGIVYMGISFAGQITGMFDGPKAGKAKSIFEKILGILRNLGAGTYRNEPGTVSVPFKGDSGKRVVVVEEPTPEA